MKEGVEKLEKDKKISQDEQKRTLEELDKLAHSETKKIEDLSAPKKEKSWRSSRSNPKEYHRSGYGVFRFSQLFCGHVWPDASVNSCA